MAQERFNWGRVINRFDYDFDGKKVEVIKYHPWKTMGGRVLREFDEGIILFHVDAMSESYETLHAMLIAWIARDRLGINQHALVAGICRALDGEKPAATV